MENTNHGESSFDAVVASVVAYFPIAANREYPNGTSFDDVVRNVVEKMLDELTEFVDTDHSPSEDTEYFGE